MTLPRRHLLLGTWPAVIPGVMTGLLPGAAAAASADTGLDTLAPRPLQFPRDHGSHPGTRTEWWYVTGTLNAAEGPPNATPSHGFQVTFFRSRTGLQGGSAFAPTQLILAHAALTDLRAQRQWSDQRLARAGFGVAGASEADTDVHLRDWHLRRQPTADTQRSRYQTRIASEAGGFAFDFSLQATQPLLLQGEQGWSRKGPQPAQASHYVSEPQLAVQGTLTRRGAAPLPVRGRAWLDHEWSNSVLDPQAVGWDWIGINLDDGSALTAFQLRRADGSALWAGGSHRSASGVQRSFGPGEVQFTPGRRWASPATRASYPVMWTVRTPLGTHQVRALLDAQELGAHGGSGTIYWEGLSALLDPAGRTVGHGYLEMTGYAAPLTL